MTERRRKYRRMFLAWLLCLLISGIFLVFWVIGNNDHGVVVGNIFVVTIICQWIVFALGVAALLFRVINYFGMPDSIGRVVRPLTNSKGFLYMFLANMNAWSFILVVFLYVMKKINFFAVSEFFPSFIIGIVMLIDIVFYSAGKMNGKSIPSGK